MIAAGSPPTLRTERLILRAPHLDDFATVAAMWADPAVTRYIGDRPRPREESWSKFLRNIGHWATLGFGYWIVTERDGGAVVGEAGFADLKRAIEPSIAGALEAGWVFCAAAHGRGYATEAMRAALQWADDEFSDHSVCCIIEPAHIASIRVAEKLGFRLVGERAYHDAVVNLYRRP